MTFFELYTKIPEKMEKRRLRNKIIEACGVQHSTFYSWMARKKVPYLGMVKISEILELPQLELFPENENN